MMKNQGRARAMKKYKLLGGMKITQNRWEQRGQNVASHPMVAVDFSTPQLQL